MTRTRRYGVGLGVAAVLGLIVLAFLPAERRTAVAVAMVIGFAVQGPLGWLVARRVGTQGLLGVWGVGMLVRLTALAIAGFTGYALRMAAIDWFLIAIVATMFGLLQVEVVALLTGDAE